MIATLDLNSDTMKYKNERIPNPYKEHQDSEMWREAYLKEYHSHMLTFKVLRQAEYDLDCANKEIERLRAIVSVLNENSYEK